MRRDLTTRSIILDTTERLKIGRQLENSSLSKVDFLSCGEMRVSLRMGHATHPNDDSIYRASIASRGKNWTRFIQLHFR